ncbi:MAG: hypothetical protein JNN07_25010 [Verrucomicrobiales bacterium]|nr:hypothetical protein [Verrucomicrobiales bacterium]
MPRVRFNLKSILHPRRLWLCRLRLLLGLFGLGTPLLIAAPPDWRRFTFQSWHTDDGLPQNHSTSIVQTRDGYLWFGTYSGLARFDGVQFRVFNAGNTPGMVSSRITSLFEDRRGVLWVGHDAGELTRFQEGRFEAVRLKGNPLGGAILSICDDESGQVWVLHPEGTLTRVEDGRVVSVEQRTKTPTSLSLAKDAQGALWRVYGGKLTPANPTTASVPSLDCYVVRACSRRAGGLWVACSDLVQSWDPTSGLQVWGKGPWGDDFVTAMLENRAGYLWVGTQSGGVYVLRSDGSVAHFTRTNGLPHDWVRSLGEDSEGNVWIGTGGGVCAARERIVTMAASSELLRGRTVLTLQAARDGSVWMGTEGAGVFREEQTGWRRYAEAEGLSNPFVWSIVEDPQGEVWAGTWAGGLFRWTGSGFSIVDALRDEGYPPVTSLFVSPQGGLWMGTQKGVRYWKAGEVRKFAENWERSDVRALVEAPGGEVWFGMSGGGLGRLNRDGTTSVWRQRDGLPSDYVWSLLLDSEDSDILWIGTFGGGLCRLRSGKISVIGEKQGLPNSVLTHLVEDGRGYLWCGSYGGILRASKQDLKLCAEGQVKTVSFHVYGKADGLASVECSGGLQPAGTRTKDGRLWFSTTKGPAVIDPASLPTNSVVPRVIVEELLIDGEPRGKDLLNRTADWRVQGPTTIVVEPGEHRFQFQYTAPSFAAPDRIQFRYRLEGIEADWVNVGNKRVANYSFLVPGEYIFWVAASQAEGHWSELPAAVRLLVLPHWWERWWARVVAILLAGVTVGWGMYAYARQKYRLRLERSEQQRAIERERARIAKDIHDDLGASLTRITLLSQAARADLDRPEVAAIDIDRIYSTAHELTRAMDEIVWAVNPAHDTLESLVNYLGQFAQQFLQDAGVRCRLDVPLSLPAVRLSAEIRHHVFLAFKEALNNVVKHAGASEVRITLEMQERRISLGVEDNGQGFSWSEEGATGEGATLGGATTQNGLGNMKQRLREIGGQCLIESQVGQGTRVVFRVEHPTIVD